MPAIAPAIGIVNVWEGLLRRDVRSIHAVADQVVRRDIEAGNQYAAAHHPGCDVNNIVREPAAVGKAAKVAGQYSQALSLGVGGWRNAGVET